MKSSIRNIACIFMLLGMIVGCYNNTGTIIGSITDNSGNPVQGAVVSIEGTTHQTTADQDGNYEINDVPFGDYTIIVTSNSDTNSLSVSLSNQSFTSCINLNMNPNTVVEANIQLDIDWRDYLSDLVLKNEIRDVFVKDNFVYLTGANIFIIAEASDPLNLKFVASSSSTYKYRKIYVEGNYAYVSGYLGIGTDYTLFVIDITNINLPVVAGSYPLLDDVCHGIIVSQNYAYVAAYDGGVKIIDVSNPNSPVEVGSIIPDRTDDIAYSNNYVYAAAWTTGFRVIDVSNRTSPVDVGGEAFDRAHGIAVSGSYVYVAGGNSGLKIFNVSNPSSVVEVGTCIDAVYTEDVYLCGNYAFVKTITLFEIIDITDPSSPQVVGTYDRPEGIGAMFISGNYAYITDSDKGLGVLDIINPLAPSEIKYYSVD
jgi:hypothetical protein